MQITILTFGSRGDVEPFIALAKGLVRSGHRVRLAAPRGYAAQVGTDGVEHILLPGNPGQLTADLVQRAGVSPLRLVFVLARHVLPLADEIYKRAYQACQGAHLLIHSFLFTMGGHEIARQLGVPDLSVQFFPVFTSTDQFPAIGFPNLPLGSSYRRMTHQLSTGLFWHSSRLLYGRLRRQNPHLPQLTGWPFSRHLPQSPPILYAFSPHVISRPSDWPENAHITGYWFHNPHEENRIPAGLREFIQAGPPPIYIGFGSMVPRDAGKLARIAIEALARTRQRGVLAAGGANLKLCDLPDSVYPVGSVPHGWLFPRMAAVVHHGGAGTTGAGLRSGVPNIIIPFIADQPFWANRAYQLGVAPRPIPLARITPERLAQAIRISLEDTQMRQRAALLGERMRSEDGVAQAVELVSAY